MRRRLALLALVVTTWSNVAVLRCAPAIAQPGEAATEAVLGQPVHTGHGPSQHEHSGHDGNEHEASASDDGPTSHPSGNDCGVVMACGTALGGQGVAAERGIPATFAETSSTSVASPSAADLTRDPPPPRRNA